MLRPLLSVERSHEPCVRKAVIRALTARSREKRRTDATVLTGTTVPEDEPPQESSSTRPRPMAAARFASTPRGARLARLFAVRGMEEWGYPAASDVSCAVALVVGELAANAVRHGRVPGHQFGLRLLLDEAAELVRVEVADAASAKRVPAAAPRSSPEGESGRGLLLVEALAVRWGSAPRRPLGKTVWAELSAEGPAPVQDDATHGTA